MHLCGEEDSSRQTHPQLEVEVMLPLCKALWFKSMGCLSLGERVRQNGIYFS